MSPAEGAFWGCIMAGMVVGTLIARGLGLPGIGGTIVGGLCGWALGALVEQSIRRSASAKSSFPDDDGKDAAAPDGPPLVRCSNRRCKWEGDPGSYPFCPRCGERLPGG
jgi:hypothetical protein